MQTDGKIVVAGTSADQPSLNIQIVAARYQTDGVGTFDVCVQDDKSGSILQFNSVTGQYVFTNCRKGYTFTGAGTVTVNFCKITLEGNGTNNFVTALVNTCTRKATASVTEFPKGRADSLTDSDTSNNSCGCR